MRSRYSVQLILTFVLLVKLGSSKDLSSLSKWKSIDHGDIDYNKTSKYQMEEDPNRIILLESVLTTDKNVYVAFMKKTCFSASDYCIMLRIYENYDQLRENACEKQLGEQCSKCHNSMQSFKIGIITGGYHNCVGCSTCWNYKYITARCRLPSMRIVNGFIICEELEIGGNKPNILKISIQTGKVIEKRTLDKAKAIATCLNMDPECSKKILDVNIHIMVDKLSIWILYNGEQHGILEQFNLDTLLPIRQIQTDIFNRNNRAFIISSKFYLLSILNDRLSIVKGIDTNNSKNVLSSKVTILEGFKNGANSWLHYNSRLEQLFVGRQSERKTDVYTVNKCPYEYENFADFEESSVKSTFFWSLYTDDLANNNDMIQTFTSFFQVKDPKQLKYISSILLTCPYTKCHQHNMTSHFYCRLNNVRSLFESYAVYKGSAISTKLQVHFDMVKLLEQNQFQEMSIKLNSLQSVMNGNFLSIKQEIHSLRSNLGSYFSALANFDLRKSKTDFELFYTIYDELNAKHKTITSTISDKLVTLFSQALGSNLAEIAGQIANAAIASAAFANPFSFFESTDAILQYLDRLADLAKATVDMVKLQHIVNVYFPRLKKIGEDLNSKVRTMSNKFPNMKNLVKKAMDKKLNNQEIVLYIDMFLKEYDSYRPAYDPSTIDEYESVLGEIVNELCRIIYSGNSLPAAIAQGVLASKGTCLATKLDVETLMGLFKDMFDKQSILLNAFASAVRATAARLNAEKIQDILYRIESGDFKESEINYKLSALEMLINSKIHTLRITREACSLIKYKNGNVIPTYCSDAINSAGVSARGGVMISSRLDRDMCDGEVVHKFVYIPAQQQAVDSTLPKGTVDLTRLYRGDEVIFQIPNDDWLIRHKWIDDYQKNKMIVLKEFELFIPTNSSSEISIKSSIKYVSNNVIKPGGQTYDLTVPSLYQYNLQYNQGAVRCLEKMSLDMPYNLPYCNKLSPICLISKRKIRHPTIYPSIYSKFELKLSTKDNLQTPNPKTNFYLIAAVQLCIVEPVETRLKRSKADKRLDRNASENPFKQCCGSSNEYLDILSAVPMCKPCPKDSTAKFGGLYCE